MKPRKPFLLRISPELYAALEAWAQQELRSVNGQIEYVLQEAVRKRGRGLPKETRVPPTPDAPDDFDRQRRNKQTDVGADQDAK